MLANDNVRTDQLSLKVVSTLNWGRSILGFTCIVVVVVVGTEKIADIEDHLLRHLLRRPAGKERAQSMIKAAQVW